MWNIHNLFFLFLLAIDFSQGVLNVFLDFFRKMFGGMFEVDRENSVVSMTGQGKGNMPLKTARCLEHALRVCRENEFQARGRR